MISRSPKTIREDAIREVVAFFENMAMIHYATAAEYAAESGGYVSSPAASLLADSGDHASRAATEIQDHFMAKKPRIKSPSSKPHQTALGSRPTYLPALLS